MNEKNEKFYFNEYEFEIKIEIIFVDAFHTHQIIFFSKLDTMYLLFFYMLLIIFCSKKKQRISQFSHWLNRKNKKKHNIMDLFSKSFIFAIYVEYNLATKSKLDLIQIIYFSMNLIKLIREKKKKLI